MKKQQVGVPYHIIFRHYLDAAKHYSFSGILLLFLYGIGVILGDIVLKFYYRDLFDFIAGNPYGDEVWDHIISFIISITVISLLFNLLYRLGDICMVHHQSNVIRELENKAFEEIQKHSYRFFSSNFMGSLVAKSKRFAWSYEKVQDNIVYKFWFNFIRMTGVFIVLFMIFRPLAWFFLWWSVFYALGNYLYIVFRRPYDLKEAAQDSKVTGSLADVITNALNLKLFATKNREIIRFQKETQKEHKFRSQVWYLNNAYYAALGLIMAVLEIVGMWIALKAWSNGLISAGTVVLAQAYFYTIIFQMWEMGRAISDTFKALSDASEMVEVFEIPIEVKDPIKPEKCLIQKGHIEFKAISFRYEEDDNVFSNFSVNIPAGQKVGIVGPSGAGKSSLFRLILRFMDVQKGKIEIDGQPITKIAQDDLRHHISLVPQETILFHRSLFENIAYADPEASKDEVIKVARQAHAHDFIEKLPKKYETLVGERGIKLSGGERQRIAIARAFLKKAPILLLDEATSSLDSLSEKYIQENLKELMTGKTTLVIAHRISTIQQMERILVIDQGGLVEDGTHTELLAKNGLYSQLWSRQSNGFLPEEDV